MKSFDYSKLSEAKWDQEILNYIAEIAEFKGRQELYLHQKPMVLDNLVEIAIIQSTESSNEIEGIRTTNTRIRQLILNKTKPKSRDEEEILGYQHVLKTIHESYEYIPLTSEIILQLHRDLYKYSNLSIGGKFKNSQNIISETLPNGETFERFRPLSPFETPQAIESICQSYNQVVDKGTVHPLILISKFIHDFLCIHPFNDGNGRMSRLLTTLLLYKTGYVVGKYISIEQKIQQTKLQYYDALEKSGIGWHEHQESPDAFIKYLLAMILAAYREFEEKVDLFNQNSTALEQVERAIAQQYGKFTKRDVMNWVPTISRSSVENALKELVEKDKIERHGRGRGTYYVRK